MQPVKQKQSIQVEQDTINEMVSPESNNDQKKSKKCGCADFKNKKHYLIPVAVLIFVILLTVGIVLGVQLGLKRKISKISQTKSVILSDKSTFLIGEFELKQKNLIKDDVNVKFLVTRTLPNSPNNHGRLLQNESRTTQPNQNYNFHINVEKSGVYISFTAKDQMIVRAQPQILQEYINIYCQEQRRLLIEAKQTQISNGNATQEQLRKDLQRLMNDQLGISGSFQSHESSMVDFKFDEKTQNYEMDSQQNNGTQRSLRECEGKNNFLFNLKIFFRRIASPIVRIARDSRQIIKEAALSLKQQQHKRDRLLQQNGNIKYQNPILAQRVTLSQLNSDNVLEQCVPKDLLTLICPTNSVENSLVRSEQVIAPSGFIFGFIGRIIVSFTASMIGNRLAKKF